MQPERADRFEILKALSSAITNELVIFTCLGPAENEWAILGKESGIIGEMGDVCALALGLALALPHRRVIAVDGDGSLLLELGQLPSIGHKKPKNLTAIILDNECYEALGWDKDGKRQPTLTSVCVDLASVGKACGIEYSKTVRNVNDFKKEIAAALKEDGPRMLVVKIMPAPTKAVPLQMDGPERKYRFVRHIERTENIRILNVGKQKEMLLRAPPG